MGGEVYLMLKKNRVKKKQEVHVAPNRSPEFCLKLTYLLIAYNDPVDTWGGASFGHMGII